MKHNTQKYFDVKYLKALAEGIEPLDNSRVYFIARRIEEDSYKKSWFDKILDLFFIRD